MCMCPYYCAGENSFLCPFRFMYLCIFLRESQFYSSHVARGGKTYKGDDFSLMMGHSVL